jgi:hypothetical protein
MKNLYIVTLVALTAFAFKANDKISIKDFQPSFGKWTGALTYLDYKTGKPYTMPAIVTVTPNPANDHQLILAYAYPKEPKANGNDTLIIDDNGMVLDKGKLMSKRKLTHDTLEIITEENGKDGNDHKPALIKKTYLIGNHHFSMQKDVQFEGDTTWIERDIFSFDR